MKCKNGCIHKNCIGLLHGKLKPNIIKIIVLMLRRIDRLFVSGCFFFLQG